MNSDKDTKYKETSFGEIPEDWNLITLNEVTKEIYRYPTYYNIEYVDKGIPEIRGELLEDNGEIKEDFRYIEIETNKNFPRTILEEGDIVISVRGTMGKVGFITKNYVGANITANLMRISPNHNIIFPKWFKWFFLSSIFRKQLMRFSTSTTIKTIKSNWLKSIKIPLPKIAEQKKIAEILSTVDYAIQKVDDAIEKTKGLKKGLMQELLTKGIEHKEFRDTDIGRIPKEWKVKTLDETIEINNELRDPRTQFPVRKFFYIDIDSIENEIGKIDKVKELIGKDAPSRAQRVVHKNDIIMSTVRPYLKAFAIVPKEYDNQICSTGFAVLSCKDLLLPQYLLYVLFSRIVINQCKRMMVGGQYPALNSSQVANIKIPLPHFSEQKIIAEILSTVDQKLGLEKERKQKLERIKKGLMQDLLTGSKRVEI